MEVDPEDHLGEGLGARLASGKSGTKFGAYLKDNRSNYNHKTR